MIRLEHIVKKFGNLTVIDDISLEFAEGSVTAIVGSSGAGKSTLLRGINLLERPNSGRIVIDELDVNIEAVTKTQLLALRKATAMVFQQFNLFARKTAAENVAEGLRVVKKVPKADALATARGYLDRVGLADKANHYPAQLSGGQQQRVGIARALAMQPRVLLLDEPTSALDPELVGEVLATIKALAADGQTMVLVSHEMNFVRDVAHHVVLLDRGRIVEQGQPSAFFGSPAEERTKQFLRQYYASQGRVAD